MTDKRIPAKRALLTALLASFCATAEAQVPPTTPASTAATPPVVTRVYASDMVVDAQGLDVSTQHVEMQATNAAAAQQIGQFPITYSELMEDVDVADAYTLKADGRKIPVSPSAIFTQLPQGAPQEPMFDDRRQKTIVFPNVEAGDTIVIDYSRHTKQALIPGQYFTSYMFSRTTAYGDAHGTITVPKSMPFNVEVHDIALDKKDSGDTITYSWHYSAPGQPQDTAVLSSFDRSPRLLASSFKTYDDFVRAYAPLVAPKMAITDPIRTLATQITAGATDHRKQAELIYNWVSQHIRYVGIELGSGGIVPHDAAQILTNGYGDCKDHVVLFAALLKARGIDSEMVLINLGNGYSLPDTPVLGELNHAITWIPEFKMYADTTAGVAPFGVLPFVEYGKPVVHVSSARPALRHVPVLAGGASVTFTTTTHIDDKGNIVGQTKTAATGPFAVQLRGEGRAIQAGGADNVATYVLHKNELPGTASLMAPPITDGGDAYTIDASYSLGPYPTLLTGQPLLPPSQLEMLPRPGDVLAGPLTNMTVKDTDPTACYSGHVVEDISVEAPAGRKFLNTPADQSADSPHVTLKSHWSLNGQIMALHREVTTKFDTALCSGAVRAETARMLNTIRDNLKMQLALAVAATPAQQKLLAGAQAADAAAKLGDYAKAAALFTTMLTADELPAERRWFALYARGADYLALKQYDLALADFTAGIALNKTYVDFYRYRGLIYLIQKNPQAAIADYTALLALKPDDEQSYIARAGGYFLTKDFTHAGTDANAAVRLKPDDPNALQARGDAEAGQQDYDHAYSDYAAALRLSPNSAQLFNGRGILYAGQKDYPHALADFDQAIRLNPSFNEAIQRRDAALKAQASQPAAASQTAQTPAPQ